MTNSEYEIDRLKRYAENWKCLSIVIGVALSLIVVIHTSYCIGFSDCEYKIRKSGYSLVEVNTKTNSYYVIEKEVK